MGDYRIGKAFRFSAAHSLAGYVADTHKCARLHGHNYEVTVELGGAELDKRGMVMDYAEMDVVKGWLTREVDHRNLDEVFASHRPGRPTTAENLALWLWEVARETWKLPNVERITVRETTDTWASYGRA